MRVLIRLQVLKHNEYKFIWPNRPLMSAVDIAIKTSVLFEINFFFRFFLPDGTSGEISGNEIDFKAKPDATKTRLRKLDLDRWIPVSQDGI